jgi:uncharacterized protein
MYLAFNPAKNRSNFSKHGVFLADAEKIDWTSLWAKPDHRIEYAEQRMIGFAYIGLRLYCVVFTDRDDVRRIISLRKANRREIAHYAAA